MVKNSNNIGQARVQPQKPQEISSKSKDIAKGLTTKEKKSNENQMVRQSSKMPNQNTNRQLNSLQKIQTGDPKSNSSNQKSPGRPKKPQTKAKHPVQNISTKQNQGSQNSLNKNKSIIKGTTRIPINQIQQNQQQSSHLSQAQQSQVQNSQNTINKPLQQQTIPTRKDQMSVLEINEYVHSQLQNFQKQSMSTVPQPPVPPEKDKKKQSSSPRYKPNLQTTPVGNQDDDNSSEIQLIINNENPNSLSEFNNVNTGSQQRTNIQNDQYGQVSPNFYQTSVRPSVFQPVMEQGPEFYATQNYVNQMRLPMQQEVFSTPAAHYPRPSLYQRYSEYPNLPSCPEHKEMKSFMKDLQKKINEYQQLLKEHSQFDAFYRNVLTEVPNRLQEQIQSQLEELQNLKRNELYFKEQSDFIRDCLQFHERTMNEFYNIKNEDQKEFDSIVRLMKQIEGKQNQEKVTQFLIDNIKLLNASEIEKWIAQTFHIAYQVIPIYQSEFGHIEVSLEKSASKSDINVQVIIQKNSKM